MAGRSYFGATQWMAAARPTPALRAIAPQITAASYHEGWSYQGGAFQLGFMLHWAYGLALADVAVKLQSGSVGPEAFGELVASVDGITELYRRLRLTDQPALRDVAPYYFDWLEHPSYDDFWRATAPCERYEQVVVPTLNIGGWHDCFLGGTLANYVGMRERGGSDAARRPRLIVGPWAHTARAPRRTRSPHRPRLGRLRRRPVPGRPSHHPRRPLSAATGRRRRLSRHTGDGAAAVMAWRSRGAMRPSPQVVGSRVETVGWNRCDIGSAEPLLCQRAGWSATRIRALSSRPRCAASGMPSPSAAARARLLVAGTSDGPACGRCRS
jgi:predicted acyl esterase